MQDLIAFSIIMRLHCKSLLTQVSKSHLTLTSSLVSVKYYQRSANIIIVNLRFHWYVSFAAVRLQISAMGLDRYSKTISQTTYSMLKFGCILLHRNQTSPMKPQIGNDDICTSLRIFNTHQTSGAYGTRF